MANSESVNRESYSKVYKWDGLRFAEFRSIPTIGAADWEAFAIAGEQYLAVANEPTDSTVYKWTYSTDCPAGNLKIRLNDTCIILSPYMADGQMQAFACPIAGEVQLLCTTREVTEQARTPDCGATSVSATSVSATSVSATSVSSTTMMAHILTFAVLGFWDR